MQNCSLAAQNWKCEMKCSSFVFNQPSLSTHFAMRKVANTSTVKWKVHLTASSEQRLDAGKGGCNKNPIEGFSNTISRNKSEKPCQSKWQHLNAQKIVHCQGTIIWESQAIGKSEWSILAVFADFHFRCLLFCFTKDSTIFLFKSKYEQHDIEQHTGRFPC